ncbi:MAG: carbonate dehydratase [Methyloprofundus sp.]|nr:carbonate dehydratase [Methyloprofundus sp.]
MHRKLKSLMENNKAWAKKMTDIDADFFINLSKQQTPEYLWIGCSDSRVSANQVIDLAPGEVFVHRNIANVVVHTDLNCLSVIQFAVEVLQVKHIIVCGHYGCGGIKAAYDGKDLGLIDNWLGHIKDVYRLHKQEIDALPTEKERLDLLCEKNIIEQVANVCHTSIVQRAWRDKKDLTVHGWIYSIENGLLKALDAEVSDTAQISSTHTLHD